MNTPIISLTCCCCYAETTGRQWWNRDQGYGLCPSCAKFVAKRESAEAIKDSYGIAGIHYFTEFDNPPIYGSELDPDASISDADPGL